MDTTFGDVDTKVKRMTNRNESGTAGAGDAQRKDSRLIGRLESFIPGENFVNYIERVSNYFELNEIQNDQKKVRLLINVIGSEAADQVIDSFLPEKYHEKSYEEVEAKCKKIFAVERNVIVERCEFNKRIQLESENVQEFSMTLMALVKHCEFGGFRNEALRDRLVAGIANVDVQRELLKMDKRSTFEGMIEKAKEEEFLRKNPLKQRREMTDINFMSFRNNKKPKFDVWKTRENDKDGSLSSGVRCYNCQELGHIAKFCKSNKRAFVTKRRYNAGIGSGEEVPMMKKINGMTLQNSEGEQDYLISSVMGELNFVNAELIEIPIENTRLVMELDTGSCVSVCSVEEYEIKFRNMQILPCKKRLSVVSGEILRLLGIIRVKVRFQNGELMLPLHIIDSKKLFRPLLGRDWLDKIFPNWRNSFRINRIYENGSQFAEKALIRIKEKYESLFDNDMKNPIKGVEVDIRMKENARPFVHKAYTVPFSIRGKVEKYLDEIEESGIIEKIDDAEWASPLVIVKKPSGDLRVCMDGSKTINPYIESNHYPIPLIDELLAGKTNAKRFVVLDLKGAYQQLSVNENTKKLLAINTIKGLYAYKRLPFGVKPAAQIFQSVMDRILENIDDVQVYIDDILIWANDDLELLGKVKTVLDRLVEHNVKVNLSKCQWFVDKVTYLGHEISSAGIAPNMEKVEAITKSPEPRNVTQLKAFIGMVMFYSKFLPKLNMKLAPLYTLLKKEAKWEWTGKCQEVFDECKNELCSMKLLTHYDPKKEIIVTCDASDDGIAGVLSHRINGEEKPVFFVSRTLSVAEKKYPILHREALAIVFAMEKFYKYVYGHFVEIHSDHKPLEGIFQAKKGVPSVIANRVQRYILRMSIFDYKIKYTKGSDIGHADCLSRLPLNVKPALIDEIESRICKISSLSPNINAEVIAKYTGEDLTLRKLRENILHGWNNDGVIKKLQHYYSKKEVLSVEKECVIYEDRTVIPECLRSTTLKILHSNHAGIVNMKKLARQHVYWQGINSDVEKHVFACEACQVFRKDKPKKEYKSWPEANKPFERVHLDFFHFEGKAYLIFVDSFSHWLEVRFMKNTDANSLSKELNSIFNIFGYPGLIVTDNGPPFNSHSFVKFLEERDIKKMNSPPYHPASNGSAERAVQTVKSVLRKFVYELSNESLQVNEMIQKFLFTHRNTPVTKSSLTPSQHVFSFTPNNEFSKLRIEKEEIKKLEMEGRSSIEFLENEEVLYLSALKGYTYSYPARVVKKMSEFVYQIIVDEQVRLAHINQLRKSNLNKLHPIMFADNKNKPEDQNHHEEARELENCFSPTRNAPNNSQEKNTTIRKSTRERRIFDPNWHKKSFRVVK